MPKEIKVRYQKLSEEEIRKVQDRHSSGMPMSRHTFVLENVGLDEMNKYAGAIKLSQSEITGSSFRNSIVFVSMTDEGDILINTQPIEVNLINDIVRRSNSEYLSKTNLPLLPEIPEEDKS